MVVVRAPGRLLAAGASLFLLIPLAVATAGVFSRHVWWDLPLRDLAVAGWVTLLLVGPLSWRIVMGRRGSFQAVSSLMMLSCLFLALRALWMKGTLQGVWSLTVMAICLGLMNWIRRELNRPYFDPGMTWFTGLPEGIPHLKVFLLPADGGERLSLGVARLGSSGAFVFSPLIPGSNPVAGRVDMDLVFRERSVRLSGDVVRQFFHPGAGWGAGIRFAAPSPDVSVDFGEFLNAIRNEGHAV